MNNKIIILGDPHLGKGTNVGKIHVGSQLNSRVVDQLNLLDWVLEQAITANINTIIITGDVFEEPKPAPYLITLFIAWLKKCEAHHVIVHIILGNHDYLRFGQNMISPLDIIVESEIENVFVHKDITTIFFNTTAITLLPFRDRKTFGGISNTEAIEIIKNNILYEVQGIPITYNKVVVGHLALENSIPVGDEIDDLTNELFLPLSCFADYDYVWMGHVHTPQILQDFPYLAHIGSMDISNFGEAAQQKHIIIFDTDTAHFESKILPTRGVKKISIVIPKENDNTMQYVLEYLAQIQDGLQNSIVKVEIELESQENKSIDKYMIEKYLLERGVFNITKISESKKQLLIKKDDKNIIHNKMDEISAINLYAKTYLEENKRQRFIELAISLLSSLKEGACK